MVHFIVNFIKQNKMVWLFSVMIIAIPILLTIFFIPNIIKANNVVNVLNNSSSIAVGLTLNTDKDNTYCYYGDLVSVYKDDTRLDVVALQEISTANYNDDSYINSKNIIDGKFDRLNKNELAVSSELAKKYNIKVNSKLNVSVDGNEKDFVVKYVYGEIYSIYNIKITDDSGSVIVSSENGNLNDLDKNYIHFIEKGDSTSYKDIFLKWEELEKLNQILSLQVAGFVLLLIMLELIVSTSIMRYSMPKLSRLINYGMGKTVLLYSNVLQILLNVIPFIIGLLVGSLIISNYASLIIGAVVLATIIVLIELITYFKLKGGKYVTI